MSGLKTCKHYRAAGGGRVACAVGVDIRAHIGGPDYGWLSRSPCVESVYSKDVVACDKREYPTAEEIAADEAEMEEMFAQLMAGKSPCCDVSLISQGTARYCSACKRFVARMCGRGDIRG